jgi:hypothetical protein
MTNLLLLVRDGCQPGIFFEKISLEIFGRRFTNVAVL